MSLFHILDRLSPKVFEKFSLFHIFDRLSPKVFQKFVIIWYIWSSVAKSISKVCHYFIYLIVCRQRYFKCLSLFHIFDRLSPKVFQRFVIISYIWSSVAKGNSKVCHYFIYLIVCRQRYFKGLSLFHIFDRLSPKVIQKFVIISYIWSSVAKGIWKVFIISYIWSSVAKGISKVCHYFIYLIVCRQKYFKSLSLFHIFDRLSTNVSQRFVIISYIWYSVAKVISRFVIISYIWSSVAKGNSKVCHYFIYLIVCRQRYLKSFHYFIYLIVCHQRSKVCPNLVFISKVCHYFIYLIVCRQRYFKSLSLFHIFDFLSPKVFQKFVIISYIWSSVAKGISKVCHYLIYLIVCRQRYFKSLSLFHIFDRLSPMVFQKFVIISYIWSSVAKGNSKVCHYFIYLIVCRQR